MNLFPFEFAGFVAYFIDGVWDGLLNAPAHAGSLAG